MGAGQVGGNKLVGAGQVQCNKLVGAGQFGGDLPEGAGKFRGDLLKGTGQHQVKGDELEGANQDQVGGDEPGGADQGQIKGGDHQEEDNMTAEEIKIKTLMFASDSAGFRIYTEEVNMWKEVCVLKNEEQGIVLWLALPRNDPNDIIINKIGAEKLKKETGLRKFIEAMNEAFIANQ